MPKTQLKPRLKKLKSLEEYSPQSALFMEAYKTALAEGKLGFPPSMGDGIWRDRVVRIYHAGEDRVVISVYNPEKKTWTPITVRAEDFYPYFTPFGWEEYLRQLPEHHRKGLLEIAKYIDKYYRKKHYTPIALR